TFSSCHSSGFPSFLLKNELLNAISDCGFKHPSAIQNELIAQAVRGMNINCQARTGTGKTTTFIISTLQQIEPIDGEISAVVLCHSDELVSKINQEFERLAKYLPTIKVSMFCGDSRPRKNRASIKNNCPHISIGTPGRI
ncbi:hypothetical protein PMAYCL1PPCAC_22320, partial [Pristionchus mayeri]